MNTCLTIDAVFFSGYYGAVTDECCIGCDMQDYASKAADAIQQLLSAKGAFLLEEADGTFYNEIECELEILRVKYHIYCG